MAIKKGLKILHLQPFFIAITDLKVKSQFAK